MHSSMSNTYDIPVKKIYLPMEISIKYFPFKNIGFHPFEAFLYISFALYIKDITKAA